MRSKQTPLKLINSLLAVAVVACGLLGGSYAYFSEVTSVRANTVMGSCDVSFAGVSVSGAEPGEASCIAQAYISENGKNIEFSIEEAYPGCEVSIEYEISNNGTVPVIYNLGQASGDGLVEISVISDTEYILPGGTANGRIIVTVMDTGETEEDCGINVALNFQQAAVVS